MEPILVAFLLVIFTLVTVVLWKKSKDSTNSTPNLPPGPWKLPIIGNLHQLIGSLPHRALRDLAKKYGPVMQLQIGEVPTVIISSAQAAKEVLKTNEHSFIERPYLLIAKIMLYSRSDIAFAPHGDYWRETRKACILDLLCARRVKSFRLIREEEVSNFINTIKSKIGLPINLSKMMFDLSNSITARTSIGKICKNQEAFFPIIEQVMEAIGGMNIVDVFPSSKLLYMISKVRSRLEKIHHEADDILENIINERRVKNEVTKIDHEDEAGDLLDVLLNLQKNENFKFSLSTDGIKAIILEMFSGGSDTSSTLLEWIMSALLKNPRIMKKAQTEVRQVLGSIANVDETGLHNLKFFKLIIKETLRLHPPIALIPRQCSSTCKINGYVIQAGTKVMINAWALGRDSNHWIDAEKFYPERFLNISTDYKGSDFDFIPFGAGKRMCPGILFGIANVELTLAQLLYHFDWKLPNNGEESEDLDMIEVFGGSIRRKHQLNLIPTMKENTSYIT